VDSQQNVVTAPQTVEGNSVSLQVQASTPDNTTLTYSATGLPSGLSINASTGAITGTITASASTGGDGQGHYSTTITVTDGTYTGTVTLNWTVAKILVVVKDQDGDPVTTPLVAEGDSVALQVFAQGGSGTLTYSATGLPPGLSINSSTGAITGTVSEGGSTGGDGEGNYTTTITVTDGTLTGTATLNWSIFLPSFVNADQRPKLNGLYVGIAGKDPATMGRRPFQGIMTSDNKDAKYVDYSIDLGNMVAAYVFGTLKEKDVKSLNYAKSKAIVDDLEKQIKAGDIKLDDLYKAILGLKMTDVEKFINQMSDDTINSTRLDLGCVGFVSSYLQTAADFRASWIQILKDSKLQGAELWQSLLPTFIQATRVQDLKGVRFYKTEADAAAWIKDNGGTMFAMQGTGAGDLGALPKTLDKNSIDFDMKRGNFNFAIYFEATKTWAYLDPSHKFGSADDDQTVTLLQKASDLPKGYLSTMFMVLPPAKK
jgi:hypothetical protein